MKQLIRLLTLLLFSIQSFGQTDQELAIEHAINARTTTEIENFKGKYKFYEDHWDLLNYGIVQTNYQLGKRKNFERVGLLTLTFNSEIFYSEVYSWDFDKDFEGWEHETLESKTHDVISSVSINSEHLGRLPYRSTFGYACGAGAGMPLDGQIMLKLAEETNIIELSDWLNSLNPVRQAYAYLGLSLIAAKGIEISVATSNKMKELQKSSLQAYSCYGCTTWQPIRFSELLNKEQVQRFIDSNLE
jgi:hypothetical protein